ncbi:platelet glycoprotein 4-like [Xyrauchen texanus]|uniref:platelet glycoprotein 4-like n=1 Tax=Xyrauchen texanus TaxID=154827 RepID=UPI002241BBEA|nr:platelet glycoprotein 4-like [Xyrauchen texanus]
MTCCDQRCGLITGMVLGALIAVLGGILIPVGDLFIKNTVNKEVVLENGTLAFDTWTSVDISVYRQFWIYDVQNPDDVLAQGAKPKLAQKGPYTYKTRYIPKTNITFNDNYTVSFVLEAGAIFEPSMSVGSEEDVFTTLNLAVAGLYGSFDHKLANVLINMFIASLFQKRTVRELLWGYREPMLNMTMLGVFYPYNGTTDGPYTVFTGKDDVNNVAMIDRWQGEKSVSYWDDTYCNMINGTDGASFPPFLDKKKPLEFFSPDICRSISTVYDSTIDLKGINVYRYKLPAEALASPADNPDNQCYCTNNVTTNGCTMAGLLDVTSCRGIPVYISLPHFLYASEDVLQGVEGLSPNFDEHSIFMDVEPITGFTLRFAKRLQLNMFYGPSKDILILNNITKNTVFPILWVNETAVLDDETAEMFKKELISRIDLLEGFQIGFLASGSVIFVLCLIWFIVASRKSK